MSIDTTKPYEDKNIIERHTTVNGDKQQFNLASAIVEMDVRLKLLEDTMVLFIESQDKKDESKVNLLIPDHLKNNSSGLIL